MSNIYVTSHGAVIGLKGGRLEVRMKDEVMSSIPKENVESISIFGNSNMTTQCIQFVLDRGIPVGFYSGRGKYFGRLESTIHHKSDILRSQIICVDDDDFCLELARKIACAKIRNQEVVLKRYIKAGTDELERGIVLMKSFRRSVEEASSIEMIMGYEGIAARKYFECIGAIIEPAFKFKGRSKRPPRDAFNSLLSFGYTVLMYDVYGKIEREGLSPYYGVLHHQHGDSPSLASDLMEEWRSVIVDSLVLSLIQGHEIGIDEFETDENAGVYITKGALNKYIKKYEKKMNGEIKYLAYDDRSYSERDAIALQCKKFKECVIKGNPDIYMPVVIR